MIAALIRKEIKENVFSKKSLWIYFAVTILFSGLALSFVSVKELNLLAQVEVNMTFMKVVLGISILVTIIIGSNMYAGERERETLESLLLSPLSRVQITFGKLVGLLLFWFIISLLSLPYFYALAMGTDIFMKAVVFLYFICFPLVIGFSALSLGFSAILSSTKSSTLLAFVLFLVTAIPMFLSTTMKKSGFAHIVDTISPLSRSMLTLKDYFVNRLGFMVLMVDLLPVLIFLIISIAILLFANNKITLKGGE
ncbi:ABC transporter permease [Psychrobacillus sp. L3]|uniref:ABC transporter permease n=1 Tax=Psychrobacillus sp. L3 TaxID=3236891 RepID=UPI0036F34577